ncbi:CYTH and CHAD domain-containing protein [Blastococcus sp. CT_GayMR19]|uniref:CYTH and CHAD domain-containing protein n=1 Tax=Blastococcus sp. CT_GayMR19 TaxID=2559608 RepID=UPI001072EEE8|nr:CYTH and CHAD domain-containing protein [Blastococcus sp. CT_GayMR19]TFV77411.1 CYTH and CHAD domain-containing protein [Blastococcus sp. CT_GayMR19]
MPTVHREVEKKYAADDGFELPPLLELAAATDDRRATAVAPVAEGEPVRHTLSATYFDTADLRLANAGLTLRRRTGGDDAGWHLKVPAGKGARSEVRLPLGRGARTVPAPLRQMVWARSLGATLRPVAEILTDRTVRRLVDVTGHVLAELADDRVTARRLLPTDGLGDAAGATTSWREIEVELAAGDEALLAAVDARLRERGLEEAPSASKLAQVLDVQRQQEPAGARKLTAKSAGGETVLAHVREQVEQIRTQDLPVRLDAPDAVHKMRVATRRLRSALTTFKPLFAPDVARPLRSELKWLAGELGAARDAEVMRDRVSAAVQAESDAAALGPVAEVAAAELDGAYRAAHGRVLAELDGDRYHDLLLALDALLTSPPLTERAAVATRKVLPGLVARSYAQVRDLVEEAATKPAGVEREELLHDARKAAKRARYAGESVSVVFGKDALAFAEAMEGVQEALGEYQDSVLTRERLQQLALHTSSPAAAFLYGRLHALEEAHAALSQEHFDTAWKAAGRKSVHRWLR